MWKCPRCEREFKRTNQSHYCGRAPETVAQYIAAQPAAAQERLNLLRGAILSACPGVREYIAWSMPYYGANGKTLSFAAGRAAVSFYAGAEAIERFAPQLEGYATKKSAVYFPNNADLPLELIDAMAKWCLE